MAKNIGQKIISSSDSGKNILLKINNIHKLGIQALPGTGFSLEGHEFIMGKTGIFEVEDNNITFTSLTFDSIGDQKIIIDYIYG